MEVFLLLNAAVVVVAYLILGLPARRLRRQLAAAGVRLADTTVDKDIRTTFVAMQKSNAKNAQAVFWLTLVVVYVVFGIGSQLYASSVEPGAEVSTWVMVSMLFYGIGLIGGAIILSGLVSAAWQSYKASALMDEYTQKYPNSPVLREVRDMVAPRVGEVGVSVVASLAVVGCIVYGLVLIAIFYMAAQTAIACARSSKCI